MKERYAEEQIIQILQEAEAAQTNIEVYRKYGISEWTYYRWRNHYQGLTVSQARRLKQLEQENERHKRLVADQALANEALKEALAIKGLLWRTSVRSWLRWSSVVYHSGWPVGRWD